MAFSNESIRIVKDLVEKYPAGPRGSLKKHHYGTFMEWVPTYNRETNVVHIRDEVGPGIVAQDRKRFFGYDPVVLYKMRLRSQEDCIRAIGTIDPAATRMSARRDGRRLWIRLEPVFEWIKQNGTEGIWSARWRSFDYGHPLYEGIQLYARERSEAESRIALISPVLGVTENDRAVIKFIDLGGPEKAMEFNSKNLQLLTGRHERTIKDLDARLEVERQRLEDARQTSTKIVSALMMMNFEDSPEADEEDVP
jgi:hypothetical protein